jgi:hypothetical protein
MTNKQIEKNKNTVDAHFERFRATGCAIHHPKLAREWDEVIEAERNRLNALFPKQSKRTSRNAHIDKITLIKKYHQIYLAGRFPNGIPENFLTPEKVCAIVQRSDTRIKQLFLAYGNS